MRCPAQSLLTPGLTLLVLGSGCTPSSVEPPSQTLSTGSTTLATATRLDLGTLGGEHSYATDINDAGVVVGWSEDTTGVNRAFLWTPARGMVDIGTLPGDQWSRAISITTDGEILGLSGRTDDGNGTPVAWAAGGSARPLRIPLLPGATSMLLADRNSLGQVIGSSLGGSLISHAWMWDRARGMYDITAQIPDGAFESYSGGSNNRGLVVGTNHARVCTRTPECWRAFLWSKGTGYRDIGIPGDDLGSAQVSGNALNDLGVVVGWTIPGEDAGGMQPYRWTNPTGFTLLPTFSPYPDVSGYAQAVNLKGTAVGASWDAMAGTIQAAAWPGVGGIVKLSVDDPNPSVAVAVNVVGVVVGWSSLDCCGGANHATLWRLGPGRGAGTPLLTGFAPSLGVAAAKAASEAARSGPVGCLSDPHALVSKQLLISCVAKRG